MAVRRGHRSAQSPVASPGPTGRGAWHQDLPCECRFHQPVWRWMMPRPHRHGQGSVRTEPRVLRLSVFLNHQARRESCRGQGSRLLQQPVRPAVRVPPHRHRQQGVAVPELHVQGHNRGHFRGCEKAPSALWRKRGFLQFAVKSENRMGCETCAANSHAHPILCKSLLNERRLDGGTETIALQIKIHRKGMRQFGPAFSGGSCRHGRSRGKAVMTDFQSRLSCTPIPMGGVNRSVRSGAPLLSRPSFFVVISNRRANCQA